MSATKEPGLKLKKFYADDRRVDSKTVEFGDGWKDGPSGEWSLRWFEQTRELVAFRTDWPADAPSDSLLTAIMVELSKRRYPEVEILAIGELHEVREALTGWNDEVVGSRGMNWVRERVESLSSTS